MSNDKWIDYDSLEKHFQEHALMLFRPCLGQPCWVEFGTSEFKIIVVSKTDKPDDIHAKLDGTLSLSVVGDEGTEQELVVEKPIKLLAYESKESDPFIPNPDRPDIPGWHLFSTKTYKPPVWFFEVPLKIKNPPDPPDRCT